MSDDTESNVIPIFGKTPKKETDFKKVSHLVDKAMQDIVNTLSEEDRKEFEDFLLRKHPELAMTLFAGEGLDTMYKVEVTKISASIEELEQLYMTVSEQFMLLNRQFIQSYAMMDNSDIKFMSEAFGKILKVLDSTKDE
jgi:2-oxo-4-hydroxy-4-carboxy--5-ureidoimidazoline (OHCU) decarboxylase